ncbi:MAG: GH36-type glycosyl hydrolase domain-containing protein [Candidatus Binatia bacterium]
MSDLSDTTSSSESSASADSAPPATSSSADPAVAGAADSALADLLGSEAPALARFHDSAPHSRILSNGRYWTLVTGAGTGLSQSDTIAVTRWSGDRVADQDGVLVYLRDLDSGEVWSLGASPAGTVGGTFFVRSAPGSITLGRRHEGIEATCEVTVSPDDDAEVRRISLRSRVAAQRRIEITVYAEPIVGHRAADAAHPAFAKLFVETAFDTGTGTLTARRRPRSGDELPLWAAAALTGDGELQMETDRDRFIGRGRNLQSPVALSPMQTMLSATTGSVLDPVFALRRIVTLESGAEASLAWVLAAGTSKEKVLAVVAALKERCANDEGAKALVKTAATAERARRRRFGLSNEQAECAQEIAGAMLYSHPLLAAGANDREASSLAASPLGRLGIAGDALLIVAPVRHGDGERVAATLSAASYLSDLGLAVAVAVLCEEEGCRAEECPHREAAAGSSARAVCCSAGELGDASTATLRAQARWLVGEAPPQLADGGDATRSRVRQRSAKLEAAPVAREKLLFDNGYGGFSGDGREYVVRVGPAVLGPAQDGVVPPMPPMPPMPWVNVVANSRFGFLATESGAGYTWAGNSRQNKLTPWSNDPVTDPHGEALYVRDQASSRFWSPQPGPAPSGAWCEVRHGMGSTRWLSRAEALEHEVTTFLAGEDPVRLTRVRIANRGSRERTLSLYSFARLVLGVLPSDSSRFVVTSRDAATGVLLARNPMSEDHSQAVAFAAVLTSSEGDASWTTDRASFVGRGGSMQAPRAVADGSRLDGAGGADAGDRCFAFEVPIALPPRGEVTVVFALGQAVDRDAALALVERLRAGDAVDEALTETREAWRDLTSAVEVRTPSKSFDLMMNGWLLYQALSCRMNGRSAYYQSGGAYGFRDQLQDSGALLLARPDLSRAQILLHAAHQFVEGDVLHWWHPPATRGTRTRFADDLLWLPYLTSTYIGFTGDESVLEESAPFVHARLLAEGEDEAYLQAERAAETASIYEHCARGLDQALALTGALGLPLMGTGDWNDGMNRVGRHGRGESVWMGFFLATILDLFVPIVEKRADWERLRRYRQYRQSLTPALDTGGWDGSWYRRAYYDDGTVLGSASSDECRIDAIAQAWSVLSGVASPERAKSAMEAVAEHLIDEEAGIIRLLWPPFDRTPHDPGYIKGYVPGIRENGGQYTHAAMWVIRALAKMGDRANAMRLFEMVSPVTHARDRDAAGVYKVEPYVVAADIYGVEPHLGRGGWTWYTGSAGWMYRTGIESLLGLTIEDGRLLRVKPCIPDSWPGFRIKYRLPDRRTVYDIEVENPSGRAAAVVSATIGNVVVPVDRSGARIVLRRDSKMHKVKVVMG